MKHFKNQPVNVTRMSFGRDMRAYPTRIELNGRTYEFADRGLSCTVKNGNQQTHILALTDGDQQFWIREGAHGIWTLIDMSM